MIDGIKKTGHEKKDVKKILDDSFRARPEPQIYVNHHYVSFLQARKWYTILGAVLVSLIIAIAVASYTAFASVVIYPNHFTSPVSFTKILTKDAPNGTLGFQLVALPVTKTEKVAAVAEVPVTKKARGTVVIFNKESAPQTLKEHTRLEAANGQIYFIMQDKPFTIPGGTEANPGSIEVTIEASEAGDTYNQQPTDFVIPGWREAKSPKFKTQYARSKSAITGGFVGTEQTLTPDELASVQQKLQERIRIDGSELIRRHILDDTSIVEQSIQYTFGQVAISQIEKTKNYQASLTGTVYAYVVSKNSLVHDIANSVSAPLPYDAHFTYALAPTSKTKLVLDSQADQDPTKNQTIQVTAQGNINAYVIIDPAKIQTSLAGKNIKELKTIFKNISGISRAEIRLRPFWLGAIPKELKKVRVSIPNN